MVFVPCLSCFPSQVSVITNMKSRYFRLFLREIMQSPLYTPKCSGKSKSHQDRFCKQQSCHSTNKDFTKSNFLIVQLDQRKKMVVKFQNKRTKNFPPPPPSPHLLVIYSTYSYTKCKCIYTGMFTEGFKLSGKHKHR